MAVTGTKLSAFPDTQPITDAVRFVGNYDNGDGTFTDFNFTTDQMRVFLASSASEPLFITITADTGSIIHPSLIGATQVSVYSGAGRMRDNDQPVWDATAQVSTSPVASPDGFTFNSMAGQIIFGGTRAAGELFIVDFI